MSGTDAWGDAEKDKDAVRAGSGAKQETFSKKTFGLINSAPVTDRDINDVSGCHDRLPRWRSTAQVRKALKVDASFKARPAAQLYGWNVSQLAAAAAWTEISRQPADLCRSPHKRKTLTTW